MPRVHGAVGRLQRKVANLLSEELRGTWRVHVWGANVVTFTRKRTKNVVVPAKTKEDIELECMNLCRLRLATRASMVDIRDNIDRSVRWDLVETYWNYVASTICTKSTIANGHPAAWCSFGDAWKLQSDAITARNAWQVCRNCLRHSAWCFLAIQLCARLVV